MSESISSLDIILPGCAGVLEHLGDAAVGQARGMLRLLSRASKRNVGPVERWLCDRAALTVDLADDLPVGPLCRLGDTGRSDGKWWLRADMVHKRADRDQLLLLGRESLVIDAPWAERLAQRARPLLEEEGLMLDFGSARRWYIGVEENPQLRSYDPSEAMGRSLNDFLPTGQGRRRWQRLTTELQMLMHDVTQQCPFEGSAEFGPNSVWLWGAGRMPVLGASTWDWVCADEPLAKGLGRAWDAKLGSVPASFTQFEGACPAGRGLLVLSQLACVSEPLMSGRAGEIFAKFCGEWLEPLALWLGRGAVSTVSVHLGGTVLFEITSSDRWRWWRRSALNRLLAPAE